MLSEKMAESGLRVTQIVGTMASPMVSPGMTAVLEDLLVTENEFRKMLMKAKRADIKKFSIDKEKIKGVLAEKEQAMQMQMMQQQPQGGMGGGMAGEPGAGAPVPQDGQAAFA
jgi:hypothetical protein